MTFEPILDPIFLTDSYGYRAGKSALDTVGEVRKRCWKYDWVLETAWKILVLPETSRKKIDYRL